MKPSILITIKSSRVDRIIKNIKKYDIRTNRPCIETPFKCYLYCAKPQQKNVCNNTIMSDDFLWKDPQGNISLGGSYFTTDHDGFYALSGRVVGNFICDKIDTYTKDLIDNGWHYFMNPDLNRDADMENWQIEDYGKNRPVHLWHISNLQIYDVPKFLTDFAMPDLPLGFQYEDDSITAPRTWRYIQERKN